MRKIIVIGTLHAELTPEKELEEVIESYKPDQIWVEVQQKDIEKNNLGSYPPEMIFAYKWAVINGVEVAGFDSEISVFKDGLTEADNQRLVQEQKKLIKNKSWKDFNRKENDKILEAAEKGIIDPGKEKQREEEMLKNIIKLMVPNGTVLIITGCAHLNFLEKHLKTAIFPFRN